VCARVSGSGRERREGARASEDQTHSVDVGCDSFSVNRCERVPPSTQLIDRFVDPLARLRVLHHTALGPSCTSSG
jgi:hypothetical protein